MLTQRIASLREWKGSLQKTMDLRHSGPTALSLLKDVLSEPVSLGVSVLDQFTSSSRGLRVGEGVLVTGFSGVGKTEYAYVVAARHLLRGGSVGWVACPGSSGLCCRRFVSVLERLLCLNIAGSSSSDISKDRDMAASNAHVPRFEDAVRLAGGMERYRERLVLLLSHVRTIACSTVAQLAAALEGPGKNDHKALAESSNLFPILSAASSSNPAAVRLLIVDGLGAACDTSILERVVGQEAPVALWLSEAVARHRCALLVTDTISGGGGGASPEVILEQSSLFRHIRSCLLSTSYQCGASSTGQFSRGGASFSGRHASKTLAPLKSFSTNGAAANAAPFSVRKVQTELFRFAAVILQSGTGSSSTCAHFQDTSSPDARTSNSSSYSSCCCLIALGYAAPGQNTATPSSSSAYGTLVSHHRGSGQLASSSSFLSTGFASRPYHQKSSHHHSKRLTCETKGFAPFTIGFEGLCFA